jgi:hypothetical protein
MTPAGGCCLGRFLSGVHQKCQAHGHSSTLTRVPCGSPPSAWRPVPQNATYMGAILKLRRLGPAGHWVDRQPSCLFQHPSAFHGLCPSAPPLQIATLGLGRDWASLNWIQCGHQPAPKLTWAITSTQYVARYSAVQCNPLRLPQKRKRQRSARLPRTSVCSLLPFCPFAVDSAWQRPGRGLAHLSDTPTGLCSNLWQVPTTKALLFHVGSVRPRGPWLAAEVTARTSECLETSIQKCPFDGHGLGRVTFVPCSRPMSAARWQAPDQTGLRVQAATWHKFHRARCGGAAVRSASVPACAQGIKGICPAWLPQCPAQVE